MTVEKLAGNYKHLSWTGKSPEQILHVDLISQRKEILKYEEQAIKLQVKAARARHHFKLAATIGLESGYDSVVNEEKRMLEAALAELHMAAARLSKELHETASVV